MIKLSYLIVGTGRCGSLGIACVLTSAGIPCGHEAIFTNQGIDEALDRLSNPSKVCHSQCFNDDTARFRAAPREIIAESSYMAAPFLDHECLEDAKIIHIVRHPVSVVESFVTGWDYFRTPRFDRRKNTLVVDEYHKFIYAHLPSLLELPKRSNEMEDAHVRAAAYCVQWNELIEKKIGSRDHLRYRVEDDPKVLFNYLGIDPVKYYKNTKANSSDRKASYKGLAAIPDGPQKDSLVALAKRYGYEAEPPKPSLF